MKVATHLVFAECCWFATTSVLDVHYGTSAVLVVAATSVLPDADYPKSWIGHQLGTVSEDLNRLFGHRSFLHSLLALALVAAILGSLSWWLTGSAASMVAILVGYGSHLLADMMTLGGVQLFWPSRLIAVLPGRDEYRVVSGGNSERVFVAFALVLALLFYPVSRVGFDGLIYRMGGDDQLYGKVTKITDGDTITVKTQGRTTPVRLIGVDTPETVAPDQPIGCYGKEASDYTKNILEDRHLITLGLARTTTFSHANRRDFERLREEAEERGTGLWSACPDVAVSPRALAAARLRETNGKTRAEAAKKLTRALSDRADGIVYDDQGLTVGGYLDRWLADVQDTVRKSTHERYKYAIKPHIKPALGRIKLKALTPAHARWFYRERLDSGLAPATVHKLHVVLHKALKAAVADGLIPRNVAAGLKLPRITREEIDPLTEVQARHLLETVRGDRLEALYVLALNTGMRQGELLALKWDDVDLERGVLRVRRTLTHADKAYVLGEPKTNKSRRTIRLTTNAVVALRTHLSRQLEEMERVGSLYRPGGLIFATETGTIINPSNLRNRSFKSLLKKSDLPHIRFHDLRHTCATLLLSKDVNPKVVSEMLGHSSISVTLDIYSHLLPDMQEKAAKALEEALR